MSKKIDGEKPPETTTEKPKIDNAQVMLVKGNRIGGILERQVVYLKKMQRNAVKSGKVETYNKMIAHFEKEFSNLKIDETTDTTETETGFNMETL